jgi:hypothetical protein
MQTCVAKATRSSSKIKETRESSELGDQLERFMR